MKRIHSYGVAIIAASVFLAGCSTKCDCPRCPNAPTTVVTPGAAPTVVNPPY